MLRAHTHTHTDKQMHIWGTITHTYLTHMRISVSRPCSSLAEKKGWTDPIKCVCLCVCAIPSSPGFSSTTIFICSPHKNNYTHIRAHTHMPVALLWKHTAFPAPLTRWSRSIAKSCLEGSPKATDALCVFVQSVCVRLNLCSHHLCEWVVCASFVCEPKVTFGFKMYE